MLPIYDFKNEIIDAVKRNYVTIICAETGSGKSTQVPQYLAKCYNQVVVTEPRVMAAKTLAKRVAEEVDATLGEEVGYNTAYDKCFSQYTNIMYCTDGLQLIRTMFNDNESQERVLIIDEAHEWNLNIEVLIAWCKFMKNRWNTKVVIMSATIDSQGLAMYFGDDVAVLEIPGNLYDVEVEERPRRYFINTIKVYVQEGKNILVFVPGKKEISEVIEDLEEENCTAIPLHGELDWEEQKKCFYQYPNSKVVVATNVAQTSITIPDIDVVIDTGDARVTYAENGIQGLYLKNISVSDLIQRKGRAGRTKEGKYILCSDTRIEDRPLFSVPEIQRSILDRVVLQISAIGLDAEAMEFYHQPSVDEIINAKRELNNLGALKDGKVTEIGKKIVKMPVSVQFARMIAEAEKYGVTEPVMIIAAIIEMGGLLSREGYYGYFTNESKSDLLAELDTWNKISEIGYIQDFNKIGINKKSFFRIKEHIKKMRQVLFGIVTLENTGTRAEIRKSCLTGMVSHIYIHDYENSYYGIDGNKVLKQKNSCVSSFSTFIVGIPKRIEFSDRWGDKSTLNLVGFVSEITEDDIMRLAPQLVEEREELRYSRTEDAVEVTVCKYILGTLLSETFHLEKNHPDLERMREEYINMHPELQPKQEVVFIEGKPFEVHYNYYPIERAIVYIDGETLFKTEKKEVFLDSGQKVFFRTSWLGNEEGNLQALRNAYELRRIGRLKSAKEDKYESFKVSTINDVLKRKDILGEITLTMDKGGYGDNPIIVYGALILRKKTVSFTIMDDEEMAISSTKEALQYLFIQKVERDYGESRFSHQKGKKKKILTEEEKEVKKDFDSLVREVLLTLTAENVEENFEFLQEYYEVLMG